MEQSLSTLRFGQRAKRIENKVKTHTSNDLYSFTQFSQVHVNSFQSKVLLAATKLEFDVRAPLMRISASCC